MADTDLRQDLAKSYEMLERYGAAGIALRRDIGRAIELDKERESRDAAPYDGLLGLPPAWMPDTLIQEHRSIRERLLADYETSEIQRWRRALAVHVGPASCITQWPLEVIPDLYRLDYIQGIAELGEERGFE